MTTWDNSIEKYLVGEEVNPALANGLINNQKALHEVNWAINRYTGAEANWSTTSTVYNTPVGSPTPNPLSVTITTTGAPITVIFQGVFQGSAAGYAFFTLLQEDDAYDKDDPQNWPHYFNAGTRPATMHLAKLFPNMPAGTYTFTAYAWINSGITTLSLLSVYRPFILAIEGN